MGLVIAMQLPWGFYQGALMGLERQVFINGTLLLTGTLRHVGAALALSRLSPTVEAFFLWQVVISLAQTAWLAGSVWYSIPGDSKARFVHAYLRGVRGFAATVAANSLIGVVLTQLDKVLLSRILTLQQFGYYALAGTVASVVWLAIVPLNQALFPRFTTLLQLHDERALATVYHRACQALTVVIVPMSGTIAVFSFALVTVWTRNPAAAVNTSLVIKLLILGTALNGLASLAGQLQAAAGWPQLVMYTNLVSAFLLVPCMIFAASHFGAAGAAAVWVVLNSAYMFVNVPIMHCRLLRGELRSWYLRDLLAPGVAAMSVIGLARWLAPADLAGLAVLVYMGLTWLFATLTATAAAPLVRESIAGALAARRLAMAASRP
jgi:O-antigen/teichoic acid export membrane protein